MERIEVESRSARIRLPDGRRRDEPFDVAVIGAGSWSRTLPIPGLAEYAVGFKTLPEAIWLRNRVLAQLDAASEAADAEERRTALGFVFVGAGFAGIEAIGELEDFARAALAPYPDGMAADMRWLMVEASDTDLARARSRPCDVRGGPAPRAWHRDPDGDEARLDRGRSRSSQRWVLDRGRDGRVDGRGACVAAGLDERSARRRPRPGPGRPGPSRRRHRRALGGGGCCCGPRPR